MRSHGTQTAAGPDDYGALIHHRDGDSFARVVCATVPVLRRVIVERMGRVEAVSAGLPPETVIGLLVDKTKQGRKTDGGSDPPALPTQSSKPLPPGGRQGRQGRVGSCTLPVKHSGTKVDLPCPMTACRGKQRTNDTNANGDGPNRIKTATGGDSPRTAGGTPTPNYHTQHGSKPPRGGALVGGHQ